MVLNYIQSHLLHPSNMPFLRLRQQVTTWVIYYLPLEMFLNSRDQENRLLRNMVDH